MSSDTVEESSQIKMESYASFTEAKTSLPITDRASTGNNTVYVRELNEKVRKSVLLKTQKLRGQAFVVFAYPSSAAAAIQNLQKLLFFGKEMTLEFARTKSKIISKLDGTLVEEKPKEEGESMEVIPSNVNKTDQKPIIPKQQPSRKQQETTRAPPNKVLFIQNLPSDVTQPQLEEVFQSCIGYKEVRVVPGNRGLAFVEFNNERDSAMALNKYNGYSLGDKNMSISFQKRID